MYTHTLCELNNILVFVNSQVIAYHEAVNKTLSTLPPHCKLYHNILEQDFVEKSCVTGKVKPTYIVMMGILLSWFEYLRATPFFSQILGIEDENTEGCCLIRHEEGCGTT